MAITGRRTNTTDIIATEMVPAANENQNEAVADHAMPRTRAIILGSTLALAIAWIAVFIYQVYFNAENATAFTVALLTGGLGAYLSGLVRLYNDQNLSPVMDSLSSRTGGSFIPQVLYSLVPPIVGAICAGVLYAVFAAGVLEGGAFFPQFSCALGEGQCNSFATFMKSFHPAHDVDFARLLLWCFVAGFAERFVPDKLNGLLGNTQ
jgi:hypothetical protein